MDKVRFGVLGAGGIADRKTIPAMLQSDCCQLVALMNVTRNAELSEKYGVLCYDQEDDLLVLEAIEAVYIASPVHLHLDQIRQCAAAYKHILCEKPLTRTAEESKTAIEVCKTAGVLLQEGYMMRFHKAHRRILEILEAGEIGVPVYARAQLACWYPPIEGAWRQAPQKGGGGALIDMATHLYDLLEMFLGRIDRVAALTNTQVHDYPIEDSSTTLLSFESGTHASVDSFFCVPDSASKTRLEIYGSKGSILAEGTLGQGSGGTLEVFREKIGKGYNAKQSKEGGSYFIEEPFDKINPYRAELDSFAKDIRAGKSVVSENTADQGRHILEVVEAAYESSRSGSFMDV